MSAIFLFDIAVIMIRRFIITHRVDIKNKNKEKSLLFLEKCVKIIMYRDFKNRNRNEGENKNGKSNR